MKVTIRLFPIMAVLCISGCLFSEKEQSAGGEDFPNSLGVSISDNLNEIKGWNLLDSVPRQLPGSDVSIPAGPPPIGLDGGVPLSKTGAGADDSAPNRSVSLAKVVAQDTMSMDTTIIQKLGDTLFIYSQKVAPPDSAFNFRTIRRDTLVIVTMDSIEANNRVIIGYGSVYRPILPKRLASYSFDDADGDGMVHPLPGQKNWVRYQYVKYDALVRASTIIIDAGPDNDFGEDGNEASKDNKIVSSANLVSTTKGDTLEFAQWRDYDGDSIMQCNSGAEKCQVTMVTMKYAPFLKTRAITKLVLDAGPDLDFDKEEDNLALSIDSVLLDGKLDTLYYSAISRSDGRGIPLYEGYQGSVEVDITSIQQFLFVRKETMARMVVFPADSNKNYPIRYSEVKSWPGGRRLESSITGQSKDNTFRPGDTLTIQITDYPVWPKNVKERSLTFKAGLGEDPVKEEDNELFSLEITREKDSGDPRKLFFSFVSDKPLKEGQVPEGGVLELKKQYQDGTQESVSGNISPGRIEVTYHTRDNKNGMVILDLDGKVIEK